MLEMVRRRKVSARELMEAHLAQIERVNPQVNALVTLIPEQALAQAEAYDAAVARGEEPNGFGALPIAHKDLADTRGIRTTYGSPLFADHIPEHDALIVERLKKLGITIGKTNTPEFGAGSQTFNAVFGRTLNPYNTSKTCGGSSGGAAVALACGMVPFADGSDMGGSLRNPAAFCNVVGFRPSPGRVPSWPTRMGWSPLSVEGPMARTVADVALMLSFMAGPDARSPIALQDDGGTFAPDKLKRDMRGCKIAWSESLGGLPIESAITDVLNGQRQTFVDLGCEVISADPDLSAADHIFKTLRAQSFALGYADLIDKHRGHFKETVIWNTEVGLRMSALDVARAEEARTQLYHRMNDFMADYDYLICPVTQILPFDVTQEYPTEINGEPIETYIDWMRTCYYITVLGFPAISMPCGFSADGLPVGVQIIGRHRHDLAVLQLAYAFEQATNFWRRHPALAVE